MLQNILAGYYVKEQLRIDFQNNYLRPAALSLSTSQSGLGKSKMEQAGD